MLELKIRPKKSTVWLFLGDKISEGTVNAVFIVLTDTIPIISYDIAVKGSNTNSYRFPEDRLFNTKEELKENLLKLFDE